MLRTGTRTLLATGLVALLVPSAAAAETINVDTTGDTAGNGDAFCSLREAVRSAVENSNAHEAGCEPGESGALDTIQLQAATYTLSLPATGGDGNLGLDGDLDHLLGAGGDLKIAGAGLNSTTIDANDIDRAFDLGSAAFTFEDLTIENGLTAANNDGGAISVDGSVSATSLTLTNTAISSSTASGAGGDGGAIQFVGGDDSSITITDSVIDSNSAGKDGGGINAPGVNSVQIDGSEITGNQLNSGGIGAGLHMAPAGVTDDDYDITDSEISGNTGADDGGGIATGTGGGDLTIARSVISANVAEHGGGGISVKVGSATVQDSVVSDNDAVVGPVSKGGAIDVASSGTTFDLIRSTLSGNEAGFRGGGLATVAETVRILNSTLSGNDSLAGSAAFISDGAGATTALLNHATVSLNTGAGSAIRMEETGTMLTVTFRESIIDQTGTACDLVTGAAAVSGGGNYDLGTTCSPDNTEQNLDATLLPLADNGGTTPAGAPGSEESLATHALPVGSSAVDSIPDLECTEDGSIDAVGDQRGFPRRPDASGGACDPGAYELTAPCFGLGATVLGAAGNDDPLNGTPGDDVISALGGQDVIDAGGGHDRICAGDDDDDITPGEGDDQIDGGAGSNRVRFFAAGGVDADLMTGTAAGEGADTLTLVDRLNGGPGDDTLAGDANVNQLFGGDGDDTLIGRAALDTLDGEGDDDVLQGDTGNDVLTGGDGDDTASYADAPAGIEADLTSGSTGPDGADAYDSLENLKGSAFDDTLAGDGGDNAIDGGAGSDTVDYSAGGSVSVNLRTGTATGQGADTLPSIENVLGSPGDDMFTVSDAANTLDGSGGTDTASFAGGAAVNANLGAGTASGQGADVLNAIENLTGSGNSDTLTGNGSANALDGAAGNDTVKGLGGNDSLTGGSGSDTGDFRTGGAVNANLGSGSATGQGTDALSSLEHLLGSPGADVLVGSGAANRLTGGGGNDRLIGKAGRDTLRGQAGNDRLFGGGGLDRLFGNAGRDFLFGGGGRDRLLGGAGRDALAGQSGRRDLCNGQHGRDRRRAPGCEIRRSLP